MLQVNAKFKLDSVFLISSRWNLDNQRWKIWVTSYIVESSRVNQLSSFSQESKVLIVSTMSTTTAHVPTLSLIKGKNLTCQFGRVKQQFYNASFEHLQYGFCCVNCTKRVTLKDKYCSSFTVICIL